MDKLVRFRMLSSTLSVSEYRNVICNVLDENNLEEFSSMFFNHFCQKLRKKQKVPTQNALAIQKINNEIVTIIAQRKSKQTQTETEDGDNDDESTISQPLAIAHFPDTIIQEIASFLPFTSYSNFQCCSRSIFYAANNPSSLYEIDCGLTFEKCIKTIDGHQIELFMKRFERIRKLIVCQGRFKYLSLITFRNLKHLELLTLDSEMKQYRSQNVFNFDSITNLSIRLSHESIEIIKRCKNLRYFKLCTYWVQGNDYQQLSEQLAGLECFSNLKQLYVGSVPIDMAIVLKNMCNSLESLSIRPRSHHITGMTFNNLTELALNAPTGNDIISIIQTTKQLKRLKIQYLFGSNSAYGNVHDYKLAMKRIFELNKLQHLYIEHGNITCVQLIPWIEVSFDKQRESLTLELDHCDLLSNEMHIWIMRLWNALCAWHTNNVTLILKIQNNKKSKEFVQWLDTISKLFVVERLIINKHLKITISNNFRVFDGYKVLLH